MSQKAKLTVSIIFLILMAIAFFLNGCATSPCRTAEEVMSDKGVVLDCHPGFTPDTHDPVTICFILPKHGKAYEKIVVRRHCAENN